MTILLCDPRVGAVGVRDTGEPLVALDPSFGPARALVRAGLAARLAAARDLLPAGIGLRVVEGHRAPTDQQAIITRYAGSLRAAHPGLTAPQLHELTSRYVAPLDVAPHVAGAAVDLTLVDLDHPEGPDADLAPLDLGCPLDATPEESAGRCFTAAEVSPAARAHRDLMARVLGAAGLVNYPTEWWHWSYGDRYWALLTGAEAALYGPVALAPVAA